ncbi:MAG: Holliday junction DNA helicase RuvA [Candidatus Omnitrophota bacterium]|jgi:Holliday junction DNA helicase RuvA|nr:MAG: Holliday junction DNA helicase RuvA [Candidatus Omnitrophota bacterium]
MIVSITGKLIEKGRNHVVVQAENSLSYEVLLPATVIERLDEHAKEGECITFITYHYLQVEPSRSLPVLIGFLNEIEKEFFEVFITVSGIGPRAALRALNQPISLIARAIDEGDIDFLKSLPGIGQQRAREIIAKLQNKVGKFGLIQDKTSKDSGPRGAVASNIEDDALAVLMQLQYRRQEAVQMIKRALQNNPDINSAEGLLNEVYRQTKG